MTLREFYPEIEPYNSGYLRVSKIHNLYYEECGNPHGKPILYLHGGPGAGLKAYYRQFFDPQVYRIILLSQRGAVQSTPFGELAENDTWALVNDLETLREHLKVKRWVIYGGSWGSTLALTYAINHTPQTAGIILRGVFLGRQPELDWMYVKGADMFFPRAWKRFNEFIPAEERGDLVAAYYRRLTSPDQKIQLEAARHWSVWEDSLVLLDDAREPKDEAVETISISKIECHYMLNHLFFENENYLLDHAPALAGIPCRIVQGQLDFVCPPFSAVDLAERYPGAELRLIADGTHYSRNPGISSELIQAMDDFRDLNY